MQHEITCTWKGGFEFDGEINGHHITLDSKRADGTEPHGPTPKPLLLLAMAGCTGMDVVPMLEKMRVPLEGFSMHVTGDLSSEHPKVYTKTKLVYTFVGKGLEAEREKIEHAVELSETKYCGVSAMLRKAFEIELEIVIRES